MQAQSSILDANSKHLKMKEWILYLSAVFFYTMMTGAVGSYRSDYLINVLSLPDSSVSLFNTLTSIIPFILNFFIAMYIDGRKTGKGGKFRPLALLVAIPTGIFLILSFWAPKGIAGSTLMIYLVTVAVAWAVCTNFGDCVNKVAIVMTPNMKERDTVMSFRGIVSAVGNSAPLVVELVIAFMVKDKAIRYIAVASLCSVFGIITMLLGMKTVRERITYSNQRKNPIAGYADVLKNKYAWAIIVSEFFKKLPRCINIYGHFPCRSTFGSR